MEKEKITPEISFVEDFGKSYQNSLKFLEQRGLSGAEKKELISDFWQKFEEYLESRHIFIIKEVGEIYKNIFQNPQKLLTRRESIQKVMGLLIANKQIEISGEKYRGGNAAVPTPEGIKIAMAEGQTDPGIISLMFFDKKGLNIRDCPAEELRLRSNRKFCKRATGAIKPEDLKYLIFRIPRQYFPEKKLLSEEGEDKFIFRGVVL